MYSRRAFVVASALLFGATMTHAGPATRSTGFSTDARAFSWEILPETRGIWYNGSTFMGFPIHGGLR